ncbi:MAG: hypothetical protein EU532_01645 [Promethearchaeota archaeon]|nr:MAG: hypothetical protein EU532_01645 [Candidatus Lokiarchaeota archaeon]
MGLPELFDCPFFFLTLFFFVPDPSSPSPPFPEEDFSSPLLLTLFAGIGRPWGVSKVIPWFSAFFPKINLHLDKLTTLSSTISSLFRVLFV